MERSFGRVPWQIEIWRNLIQTAPYAGAVVSGTPLNRDWRILFLLLVPDPSVAHLALQMPVDAI